MTRILHSSTPNPTLLLLTIILSCLCQVTEASKWLNSDYNKNLLPIKAIATAGTAALSLTIATINIHKIKATPPLTQTCTSIRSVMI